MNRFWNYICVVFRLLLTILIGHFDMFQKSEDYGNTFDKKTFINVSLSVVVWSSLAGIFLPPGIRWQGD